MSTNPEHSSFIHDLQIASPCKADWNEMSGDERKRFCSLCKLNVYNISAMTLPEAEKLIIEAEGRVCVRIFRRTDGTVITQDCPVGIAERVKRRVRRTLAIASAVCAVVIAWAGNVRLGNQPTLFEQIRIAIAGPGAASSCGTQPGHAAMMGDVAPARALMGKPAVPVHEIKGEAVMPSTVRRNTVTNVEFVEPQEKQ